MKALRSRWIDGQEWALDGLTRLARRRPGYEAQPEHLRTGLDGERAAYFYLRRQGYTVVARRWSTGEVPGDIDLIAWLGALLCIVEVKTRTAHDMAAAEVAVDDHKRRTLRRLARHYLRQLPQPEAPSVRFDVLSVYLLPGRKREFVHFEGAFGWGEENRDERY